MLRDAGWIAEKKKTFAVMGLGPSEPRSSNTRQTIAMQDITGFQSPRSLAICLHNRAMEEVCPNRAKRVTLMRISRFWMVAAAIVLLAGVASANPADVNFGIKDPPCLPTSCTLITSSTFSFTMPNVPAGQTANLLFENATSVTLTSLSFNLFTGLNVTPSLFTCSIDAFFNTCNVTQVASTITGDNEFHILLANMGVTGPCTPDGDHDADDLCGGIQPGDRFDLQFTNPPGSNSAFDWAGGGLTVNVAPAPEPASLILLVSGLLPLWTLRKRFQS